MDACADLATLAGRLAVSSDSPRQFLEQLGEQGAGFRRGRFWMIDAALAGRNRLPGRGFAPAYDDGTTGQARHFAGTASAAARLGASVTRWVSVHLRRDPLDSADGRLSEEAIAFAEVVLGGGLRRSEVEGWIRGHLCATN